MSLESWAIDKLSVFLGFDPETLQSQILPYLMSSNSPDVFAEQLLVIIRLLLRDRLFTKLMMSFML